MPCQDLLEPVSDLESGPNPFADFRLRPGPMQDRMLRRVNIAFACLLGLMAVVPLWFLSHIASQASGRFETAGDMVIVEAPLPADSTEGLAEKEVRQSGDRMLMIVRRDLRSEAELRRELESIPVLNFERGAVDDRVLSERRFDLVGLPAHVADSKLETKTARRFESMAQRMRTYLVAAAQSSDKETAIRDQLETDPAWFAPESVACLMQMLQPECRPIRKALVGQLQRIEGKRASEGLAKVAVFDLSGEVRADAIAALADRPPEQHRHVFLAAFRHPWPAAADHAAEALVALHDVGAVPELQRMTEETKLGPDQSVRELVRLNHLKNCATCHTESKQPDEPLRGVIPSPGQPLPPPLAAYQGSNGPFVRADITFLRQDFSAMLPVSDSHPWPASQRFDFMVRTRPALPGGARPASQNREAVLFALNHLVKVR